MAKRRTSFGQLTHRDLKAFDQRAARLVLDAIDAGCTGRVSSKGHAILRNNAGQTASVPPTSTSPNRSAQNAEADIKRLLEGHAARSEPSSLPVPFASPITVVEAFAAHGMAFSNWMDAQDGLGPHDKIEVSPGPDGSPLFARLSASGSTPVKAPTADLDQPERPDVLGTPNKADASAPGETPGTEEVVFSVAEVAEANAVCGRTVRNRLRAVGGRGEDGRYRATPTKLRRAGLDVPFDGRERPVAQTVNPQGDAAFGLDDQSALPADAAEVLGRIRSLLGEDPRIQVLEAQNKALSDEVAAQERRAVTAEERCAGLEKELSDTTARLALIKEACEA
ncbi:hypothetical protein [Nocardiopsis alborubida]|uniref:Uncharacterized protein n=1 Tax=Nocardiopsis alborubida TaxID=146802 RepID=A0A7X6RNW9_9ACTN|nr:hypothetical protein [Nocardiopsis alborubida]NKY96577.1 hypothetical protein [Nocardiopsis alborubida]